MPKNASNDAATVALTNFIAAVRNPAPTSLFSGIDTEKLSVLQTLATIFYTKSDDETPELPKSPSKPALPAPNPYPARPPRVETPKEPGTATTYSEMTRDPWTTPSPNSKRQEAPNHRQETADPRSCNPSPVNAKRRTQMRRPVQEMEPPHQLCLHSQPPTTIVEQRPHQLAQLTSSANN